MRSLGRVAPLFALLAIGVLWPSPARAKSEFVRVIAGHLQLPYDPPCRVCHIQGTTGPGSVQTPFGVSMLGHGLTGSGDTVTSALDGLAADRTDSDGDGKPDIDELRADTDPNTAADVTLASAEPTYGCSAAPAPARPWGLAVLALLVAVAVRARRA